MQESENYISQQKLEEARIVLLSAIESNPSGAEAHYSLAKVLARQRNFLAAVQSYRTTLELDPAHPEARAQLVSLLLAAGQYELVGSEIDKLATDNPEDENVLLLKATLERKKGNLPASKEILEKLYSTHANNIAVLASLADVCFAEGDYERAKKLLSLAIERDPKNAVVKIALADMHSLKGRFDDAQALIEDAIKLDEKDASLRMYFGNFFLRRGLGHKAVEQYEKVLELDPSNIEALDLVVDYYMSNRQKDKWLKLVDVVVEEDGGLQGMVQYFRARRSEQEQDIEVALGLYMQALEHLPKFSPVFRRVAEIELSMGKRFEAVEHLNQAVKINSADAGARLALARFYLSEKDIDKALEQLDAILRYYPFHLNAHILRADIFVHRKRFDDARKVYELLVSNFMDNPIGYYRLGLLEEQRGDTAAAIRWYKFATLTDRNILPVLRRLARQFIILKGDASGAIEEIRKLKLHSTSSSPEYDFVIASLIMSKQDVSVGDANEARRLLADVIENRPSLVEAYGVLASIDERESDLEKAVSNYQLLLSKKPEHVASWMLLAKLYEKSKNFSQAAEAYRKVLTLNPRHAVAANNLSWLMVENLNGDLNEALRLALVAKELLPEEGAVSDTLAWVYYKRGQGRAGLAFAKEAVELAKSAAYGEDINREILYHLQTIASSVGGEG
ncbi:MAG: tetratricopeptide repeat protein [Deltaproteobacteria bacterium]|nr:tetratricopeptide repeat protein [Deltaproteobacteria bacterium]